MGALADSFQFVTDAFMVECLAALKAIVWAKDMGFTDIVMEGDALTIIKKVNSTAQDLSPIVPYIAELKLLCSLFRSCSFSYVSRVVNAVAHSLAVYGLSLSQDCCWV